MHVSKKKSAFSLTELLFVVFLIGILFVIIVPKIDSMTTKVREIGVKQDFRSYQIAFEAVSREMVGLGDLVIEDDVMAIKLLNTHLDSAVKITANEDGSGDILPNTGYEKAYSYKKDPWNRKYTFRYLDDESAVSRNGMMILASLGRNAKEELTIETTLPTKETFDQTLQDIVEHGDDYILATMYYDGATYSGTAGFTVNMAGVR